MRVPKHIQNDTPSALRLLAVSRKKRAGNGLFLGAIIALLLWLGHDSNLIMQPHLSLTNLYFVPGQVTDKIVIVAVDDASLAAYGRSPTQWSRSVYGELVDKLASYGARVIAFDLLFVEETNDDVNLVDAIQAARSGTSRTRTVLAQSGVSTADTRRAGVHTSNFEYTLQPPKDLLASADYISYVNTYMDVDGNIRRQPSFMVAEDGLPDMSFALATYLAYLRVPAEIAPQIIQWEGDTLSIASGVTVHVDERGFWLQNFFGPPTTPSTPTFNAVSLRAVLDGGVAPETFDDKIVLVGLMNSSGMLDQFAVPASEHGQAMAGIEIHANAIETLLQDKVPRTLPHTEQAIIIIFLAMVSSTLYSQLRWQWVLGAAALILGAWLIAAFAAFSIDQIIVNLFISCLAILLPVVTILAMHVVFEISHRTKTEFLLTSVVSISKQQLALNRIAVLIADDIRQVLDAAHVGIWIRSINTGKLSLVNDNGDALSHNLQETVQSARDKQQTIISKHLIAAPVMWQGKVLGVLGAEAGEQRSFDRSTVNFLNTHLQQLAPGLANALLHSEMQRQRSLLEAILAGSPSGITVLNHNLKIRRFNRAARDLFPAWPSALEQSSLLDTLSTIEDLHPPCDTLEKSFSADKRFRTELTMCGKTYIMDAARLDQVKGWVVIFSDISALAELNRVKSEMIRMASHDLKNPLSRVMGYSELLLEIDEEEPELTERARTFLGHIVRDANHMNELIQGVLDLERLRSGGFEYTALEIQALVERTVDQHRVDMRAKQQNCVLDLNASNACVMGNYVQISQMISNLISNAIKYTPEAGTIAIRLNTLAADNILRFEVQDNGFGMSEEAQQKLFQPFYRVRTMATASIPGTGLGLSLVKSVAESHGGSVRVESSEETGSMFSVDLPLYLS